MNVCNGSMHSEVLFLCLKLRSGGSLFNLIFYFKESYLYYSNCQLLFNLFKIYSFAVGLDYLLFNESTIIFPRNSSLGDEQCIVFGMVLDDDVIESVETAYLFPVSTFFTDRFFVNGVPASIEVTIYSDECKYCTVLLI